MANEIENKINFDKGFKAFNEGEPFDERSENHDWAMGWLEAEEVNRDHREL